MLKPAQLVLVSALLLCCVELGRPQCNVARIGGAVLQVLQPFMNEMREGLSSIKRDLNSLNESVNQLSGDVEEHKKSTAAELAGLWSSFNATQISFNSHSEQLRQLNDKLDPLNEKQDSLDSKLDALNEKQVSLDSKLDALNEKQDSLDSKLDALNEKQDTLDSKLVSVNASLHDHKRQTEVDMDQLQTSLNSALTTTQASLHSLNETLCSKMNEHTEAMDLKLNSHTNTLRETLTATTAQLSTEHQNLQTDISDVECTDSEESLELYQNLTHQLESIQSGVNTLHGPYTCGGTIGWRRVVYLDMTDSSTTCPSGWQLTGYSKTTCGRVSIGYRSCDSATFPVSGGEYTRVCGRIKAYQFGATAAFHSYYWGYTTTIDGAYFDGVSVTHGSPQQHIWTFAAGAAEGNPTWPYVCPCDASIDIRVPPFVGEDYFCESGVNEAWNNNRHRSTLHSTDTLWDGEDCLPSSTCCSQHNPPYFIKQLPTPITDDIEARVCLYNPSSRANIAVELVELYVQ